VVVDGEHEVLELGRAQRIATDAIRRALIARDGGCACGAPAEECAIHHNDHWTDDGPTDLANLELKCPPCHWDEHEGKHKHPHKHRRKRGP
jgi:hypothetical protein